MTEATLELKSLAFYTRHMYKVRLWGRPSFFDGDVWLMPPRGKTSALLFYLAYRNDWVSRDELLFLFWPDTVDKQARGNLRSLLSRLVKPLPYVKSLELVQSNLRWQIKSDVSAFKKAIREGDLSTAVEAYQGDLLPDFPCEGMPEFEAWLELERFELAREFQDIALMLIKKLEGEQLFSKAIEVRQKLYLNDPLDESTFRQYLRSLVLTNQPQKASIEFESFKFRLWQDLQLEPAKETVELMSSLKTPDGFLIKSAFADSDQFHNSLNDNLHLKEKRVVNAPTYGAKFIGREREIEELKKQLLSSSCRLVSIVAPGGMGKTRLALAVAETLYDNFEDGIYFVSLAELDDANTIVYAVAAALKLELQPNADAKTQVLNYLKHEKLLLILDNVEHLLTNLSFVIEVLNQAPNVRILSTSREVLKLKLECVFDIAGLYSPQEDEPS